MNYSGHLDVTKWRVGMLVKMASGVTHLSAKPQLVTSTQHDQRCVEPTRSPEVAPAWLIGEAGLLRGELQVGAKGRQCLGPSVITAAGERE